MAINYPFTAIPNQIARGGHGAINLAVLTVIISHGRCTASIPTIAKEVGACEKATRKAIKYWKENAHDLGMRFEFYEGRKGNTNVIEVSFSYAVDPDRVVAKMPPGGSKNARGVVAKMPPKEDYLRKKYKNSFSLTREEQERLGFIVT